MRDIEAGTTTLVSRGLNEQPANQLSEAPSISGDGRYVAFHSLASNFVDGDTNGKHDVFLYDAQSRTLALVSFAVGGVGAVGVSLDASMSRDGRHVAYYSSAANIVPSDTNGTGDVFVYDTQTETSRIVSLTSAGTQADGSSSRPSISDDGRFVAFGSTATDLVSGDRNNAADVFVRDIRDGTTRLLSVSTDGLLGDGASYSARVSGDGRFIAFTSVAKNLVSGDTNLASDVFLRDTVKNTTVRVNVSAEGVQAKGPYNSGNARISTDGRFIVFDSSASNLVPLSGSSGNAFLVDMHLFPAKP